MLDLAGQAVAAGVTTDEVDRVCHEAAIARGAYPSPLNYHGFPKRYGRSIKTPPPCDCCALVKGLDVTVEAAGIGRVVVY